MSYQSSAAALATPDSTSDPANGVIGHLRKAKLTADSAVSKASIVLGVWIGLAIAPIYPAMAENPNARQKEAQDETPEVVATPGLCRLGDEASGRWVQDSSGQLVPLSQICDDPDAWADYVTSFDDELAAIDSLPDSTEPGMLTPDQEFWLRFRRVASSEALDYAQSLPISDVIDYGQTLCPLLEDSMTMDDVREAQIEAGLPADFDAAVNVAAIHTYCPQHITQIGR